MSARPIYRTDDFVWTAYIYDDASPMTYIHSDNTSERNTLRQHSHLLFTILHSSRSCPR